MVGVLDVNVATPSCGHWRCTFLAASVRALWTRRTWDMLLRPRLHLFNEAGVLPEPLTLNEDAALVLLLSQGLEDDVLLIGRGFGFPLTRVLWLLGAFALDVFEPHRIPCAAPRRDGSSGVRQKELQLYSSKRRRILAEVVLLEFHRRGIDRDRNREIVFVSFVEPDLLHIW